MPPDAIAKLHHDLVGRCPGEKKRRAVSPCHFTWSPPEENNVKESKLSRKMAAPGDKRSPGRARRNKVLPWTPHLMEISEAISASVSPEDDGHQAKPLGKRSIRAENPLPFKKVCTRVRASGKGGFTMTQRYLELPSADSCSESG